MIPNQAIPEGSVIITPNDMFSELRATHDEVKSVSQQMASLTDTVGNKIANLERSASDHEKRLRDVEKRIYRYAGAAAVIGVVGGFAAERLPLW